MTDPIEGKVARLLTVRDLVINRGSAHGVEVGMRFKILNPNGQSIRDPDTRDIIGSVEMVKVVVKVVEVQENLCVARTFKTIKTEPSGAMGRISIGAIASMADAFGTVGGERVETLRTNEKLAEQDIDEAESYVRTGDPAVQVVRITGGEADVEY